MRTRIVAPLALLASLSLLTSCTGWPSPSRVEEKEMKTSSSNVPAPVVSSEPVMIAPTATTATLPPPPASPMTTMTGSDMASGSMATSAKVVHRKEVVTYDSKTPEGMVDIEFDVTVTDGVITMASALPKTDKQASVYNQTNFAKDISAKSIGKTAKDLKLDAVGGASLTTAAFESFVHTF